MRSMLKRAVFFLAFLLCAAGPALGGGVSAKAPTKVAFVLLGGVDDQGWTAAHAKGIGQLRRELGPDVEVAFTEHVADAQRAEAVFRQYARQGFQLIFGTTFQHMEPINAVAAEFPGVAFMHCAGYKTLPNLGVYMARIEQGEYLAGYMAGLMGHRKVGTVATQPIPEVVRGINAFTLGLGRGLREAGVAHDADSLNAVVWLKSWRDAEGEDRLARELVASGVDLVRQMADTPDSARAACSLGAPAVGYGTDAAGYGAQCALTSTTFEWGPLYVDLVRRVRAGTWKAGALFVGFEAGAVGLAPFARAVPESVAAKVLALKARMEQGEDMSFAGPVRDQDGRERIAAGTSASDEELLSMLWFVRGVRGGLPQ